MEVFSEHSHSISDSYGETEMSHSLWPDTVMGRSLRFFFRSLPGRVPSCYLHVYIYDALLLSNSFYNGVPRCDLGVWMLGLSPVEIKSNRWLFSWVAFMHFFFAIRCNFLLPCIFYMVIIFKCNYIFYCYGGWLLLYILWLGLLVIITYN